MPERSYIAIDLKSFYASVECVERGLDPMDANLVVADASRTEKTICLAVSPALKARGIPGRARLFEVIEKVREINHERRRNAPGRALTGESYLDSELRASPQLALGYIAAVPRMARYMECSTQIYQIYLKYVAPEDVHVYSIDEVFIDATNYLAASRMTAREFAATMIRDVMRATGVTATAGIGTNLYLCKIAMDIEAKRMPADKDGVRIAQLDEASYRRSLWAHRPLTDFWRVGRGTAAKLEARGMFTMGDVARCSMQNEDLLYKLFGVNAELLIDHAWGWEPCTMAEIKAYKPEASSIGSGQVLQCPYSFDRARVIVREMTDALALDLVDKGLVTDQLTLAVGYDVENLNDPAIRDAYAGEVKTDFYGRQVPKFAHGSANLERWTASAALLTEATLSLFDRIVDSRLLVRRVYLTAARVVTQTTQNAAPEQLDMFTDYEALRKRREAEAAALAREERRQKAVLGIHKRYGKNAILKGTSFQEGATMRSRNGQIGGHRK